MKPTPRINSLQSLHVKTGVHCFNFTLNSSISPISFNSLGRSSFQTTGPKHLSENFPFNSLFLQGYSNLLPVLEESESIFRKSSLMIGGLMSFQDVFYRIYIFLIVPRKSKHNHCMITATPFPEDFPQILVIPFHKTPKQENHIEIEIL